MNDINLHSMLLTLLREIETQKLNVILGGGYGLYLKQMHLLETSTRTLIPKEAWPRARSTLDLDMFFPLEMLLSLEQMKTFRAIIDELKFVPVLGAKFLQFENAEAGVKLDLLTGPIPESAKSKLKADTRRARPIGNVELHAHPVPEAVDFDTQPETLPVQGKLLGGQSFATEVRLPSPFAYLMMKITAFGDQLDKNDKKFGRHHALDVYRIVAMLSENQFDETKKQFENHAELTPVLHVRRLRKDFFSSDEALGILRIKEHELFDSNLDIDSFIGSLQELVGV
jgi:hypothetical protein